MTQEVVGKLYDGLFRWEKKRKRYSYPIHKKLNTEKFGFSDIYEWICDHYVQYKNKHILDAGCGVGYGSLYMASTLNANVTGISVSTKEIERAKENLKNSELSLRTNFSYASYDNLPSKKFDFIVAVESIKHTKHLGNTLNSLVGALKENGTLIIIDDFLISEEPKKVIDRYSKYWHLAEVFSFDDFIEKLPTFRCIKDLTPFVLIKSKLILKSGIYITEILSHFRPIYRIVKGGLYLEQLFRQKSMGYYVIEYVKK